MSEVADALNRVADELAADRDRHTAPPSVTYVSKAAGHRLQTLFWFFMVLAAVVLLLQAWGDKNAAGQEERTRRRGTARS